MKGIIVMALFAIAVVRSTNGAPVETEAAASASTAKQPQIAPVTTIFANPSASTKSSITDHPRHKRRRHHRRRHKLHRHRHKLYPLKDRLQKFVGGSSETTSNLLASVKTPRQDFEMTNGEVFEHGGVPDLNSAVTFEVQKDYFGGDALSKVGGNDTEGKDSVLTSNPPENATSDALTLHEGEEREMKETSQIIDGQHNQDEEINISHGNENCELNGIKHSQYGRTKCDDVEKGEMLNNTAKSNITSTSTGNSNALQNKNAQDLKKADIKVVKQAGKEASVTLDSSSGSGSGSGSGESNLVTNELKENLLNIFTKLTRDTHVTEKSKKVSQIAQCRDESCQRRQMKRKMLNIQDIQAMDNIFPKTSVTLSANTAKMSKPSSDAAPLMQCPPTTETVVARVQQQTGEDPHKSAHHFSGPGTHVDTSEAGHYYPLDDGDIHNLDDGTEKRVSDLIQHDFGDEYKSKDIDVLPLNEYEYEKRKPGQRMNQWMGWSEREMGHKNDVHDYVQNNGMDNPMIGNTWAPGMENYGPSGGNHANMGSLQDQIAGKFTEKTYDGPNNPNPVMNSGTDNDMPKGIDFGKFQAEVDPSVLHKESLNFNTKPIAESGLEKSGGSEVANTDQEIDVSSKLSIPHTVPSCHNNNNNGGPTSVLKENAQDEKVDRNTSEDNLISMVDMLARTIPTSGMIGFNENVKPLDSQQLPLNSPSTQSITSNTKKITAEKSSEKKEEETPKEKKEEEAEQMTPKKENNTLPNVTTSVNATFNNSPTAQPIHIQPVNAQVNHEPHPTEIPPVIPSPTANILNEPGTLKAALRLILALNSRVKTIENSNPGLIRGAYANQNPSAKLNTNQIQSKIQTQSDTKSEPKFNTHGSALPALSNDDTKRLQMDKLLATIKHRNNQVDTTQLGPQINDITNVNKLHTNQGSVNSFNGPGSANSFNGPGSASSFNGPGRANSFNGPASGNSFNGALLPSTQRKPVDIQLSRCMNALQRHLGDDGSFNIADIDDNCRTQNPAGDQGASLSDIIAPGVDEKESAKIINSQVIQPLDLSSQGFDEHGDLNVRYPMDPVNNLDEGPTTYGAGFGYRKQPHLQSHFFKKGKHHHHHTHGHVDASINDATRRTTLNRELTAVPDLEAYPALRNVTVHESPQYKRKRY